MKAVNNIYKIVESFEYEEPNKKESDNLTEALEQFEARFGAYEIGDLISSDENDFPLFRPPGIGARGFRRIEEYTDYEYDGDLSDSARGKV